jgi:hypothetical protein
MSLPGFTAETSLYMSRKYFYGVEGYGHNGEKVIPQALPKWLLRLLGFCTVECYPIINCNPDTGQCVVEYTCVEKCDDPSVTVLV